MTRVLLSRPRIVRDHIPLEQGLRRACGWLPPCPCRVRDHIPLEQGLRRDLWAPMPSSVSVRDHIPLEQGLRHRGAGHARCCPNPSETIFH